MFHMAKNEDLTRTMQTRRCELHSIGLGHRIILQKYRRIPISTVRYNIIRQDDRNHHITKPRSGKPPLLSISQTERSDIEIQDISPRTRFQVPQIRKKHPWRWWKMVLDDRHQP